MKKIKAILFLVGLSILVNFLSQGPDLYLALTKPDHLWYSGQAPWFDPWDVNTYLGIIRQGRNGEFLYQEAHNSESFIKIPLYPLYLLTGQVSRFTRLDPVVAFHLLAVIVSFLLILSSWWLTGLFIENKRSRSFSLIILTLGGGLGWLMRNYIELPDLGMPNFTYSRSFYFPHEGMSLVFFIMTIGHCYQWLAYHRFKNLAGSIIFNFLMLFFHPYNLVPLGATLTVFGFYQLIKQKNRKTFLAFFSLATGLVVSLTVYYLTAGRIILSNANFAAQFSQAYLAPIFHRLILASIPVSLLAVIPVFQKKIDQKTNFLLSWLLAHSLVLYLPFSFQRLLVRGFWVPLSLLAIKGIEAFFSPKDNKRFFYLSLFTFFSIISTFGIFYSRLTTSPQNRWVYLSRSEGKAIEYLDTHQLNLKNEAVLATPEIANFIIGYTDKFVWLGHKEQPEYSQRFQNVSQFYLGQMTETEVKEFVRKNHLYWVFWGPQEKQLANGKNFPYPNLFAPSFENETVTIYLFRESR